MKCNKVILKTSFKINYKKEVVKFKEKIFSKKKMRLKEFALTVLQIEPVSIEVVAMYIGKLDFDVYNKNDQFSIMITKKIKNGIKGIIEFNCN